MILGVKKKEARDRHFTWSSEPREGLTACSAKEVTSYLSHFKTLINGPAPGIEPATSRSAVKRSTDWANPATVKLHYSDKHFEKLIGILGFYTAGQLKNPRR